MGFVSAARLRLTRGRFAFGCPVAGLAAGAYAVFFSSFECITVTPAFGVVGVQPFSCSDRPGEGGICSTGPFGARSSSRSNEDIPPSAAEVLIGLGPGGAA